MLSANYLKYFYESLSILKQEKYNVKKKVNVFNYCFSLTSSPCRLLKLKYVFGNLPSQIPIFLHLPLKFKNVEDYNELAIENLKQQFPQLVINRVPKDLGPQTKLLGLYSLSKEIRETLENTRIIIIDDDTVYSNDIVNIYNQFYQTYDYDIFSVSLKKNLGLLVHEGFASYSFPYKILTPDFFAKCEAYSVLEGCKLHDDFVFSAVFQDLNLKSLKVDGIEPVQLLYGYNSDSLHFQEPNVIKSKLCSDSIWNQRLQCPVY